MAVKKIKTVKKKAIKTKTIPKKKEIAPETVVKTKTEELLHQIGFDEVTVEVRPTETGGYLVQLGTAEPSLIIGYHGQTLSAFQFFLGLLVQKTLGEWKPVVVNVGDYRERREEQLRHLAQTVAQRVRFSGRPQVLTNLTPAERRIIHITLATDELVESISEGEGQDRHLIIRPRQAVI
jgi:predicted RNA-binding protein Jag